MSEKLTKDAIDLSTLSIPRLFGCYFLPTLLGMLSISAMTAIDGIFVGHAVGANGIAAINPNRSLEKVSCHFLMTAIRKTALYMLDL